MSLRRAKALQRTSRYISRTFRIRYTLDLDSLWKKTRGTECAVDSSLGIEGCLEVRHSPFVSIVFHSETHFTFGPLRSATLYPSNLYLLFTHSLAPAGMIILRHLRIVPKFRLSIRRIQDGVISLRKHHVFELHFASYFSSVYRLQADHFLSVASSSSLETVQRSTKISAYITSTRTIIKAAEVNLN